MWFRKRVGCSALILAMSCNAKLQLGDPGMGVAGGASPGGSGGSGGVNSAGTSGRGLAGADPAGQAGESLAGAANDGGDAGYAGSPTEPPPPGTLGQPCIPAAQLTEAVGSPAQAVIKTLTRCEDGLACNASGSCEVAPDCPQATGICVVHRAAISAPDGAGLGGGTATPSAAGAGNLPPVAAEIGVQAMSADATSLYWVEYGTRDPLGNYQNDGALLAMSFADSKTTTLAANVPGPNGLGITSAHAYVYVDGAPYIGSAAIGQLLRVPLTGGTPQVVSTLGSTGAFAASGDTAFWVNNGDWVTASGGTSASSPLLAMSYATLAEADATYLYYESETDAVHRLPLGGGSDEVLARPGYTFALSGDSFYGLEPLIATGGMVLDKVSKNGGAWQRVRALGPFFPLVKLQIVGDRYYFDAVSDVTRPTPTAIVTGSISSNDPPVRAVESTTATVNHPLKWIASETALYWSDGRTITSRPVSDFH